MKSVFPYLCCSLLAGFFFCTQNGFARGWDLSYGSASSQLSYYNTSINPTIEEAAPLGPMAFRVHNDELWVADSIGGRVLCIDSTGKATHVLPVPDVASNTLLEDLALFCQQDGKVSKVWVGDGADQIIRALEIPSGNELLRIGGVGEKPGCFLQIHQIEVSKSGRLYVGDYGRGTISVFDVNGVLLREHPWERSGFAIGSDDILSVICFYEGAGYLLKRFDKHGNFISSVHLGFVNSQNPRLWGEIGGSILVSFIPEGGFRGNLNLVKFSKFGGIISSTKIRPPQAMNRFLDHVEPGHFWFAQANFDLAPNGKFKIISLPLRRNP